MNELEKIIREIISSEGDISLERYMELALQHPTYGYYKTKDPLGRTGDFITSPEISQLFGEMIGVWCVQAWKDLGKPSPFALVEFGPGRGTMMADILRATAHVGGFHDAKKLCLIESDEALKKRQQNKLQQFSPEYFDEISQIPAMPSIVIANEFFDALPVRQLEKTFRGWAERTVTTDGDELALSLRPIDENDSDIPNDIKNALPGSTIEVSKKAMKTMKSLASRIAETSGALLAIDYGYSTRPLSPTVQAASNHSYAGILDRPGEVDLTAHVDFASLRKIATEEGLSTSPIIGQGEFLKGLGIELRADVLKKNATTEQAAAIDSALARLIAPNQMGEMFKVLAALKSSPSK